jgi:hypothetical protein
MAQSIACRTHSTGGNDGDTNFKAGKLHECSCKRTARSKFRHSLGTFDLRRRQPRRNDRHSGQADLPSRILRSSSLRTCLPKNRGCFGLPVRVRTRHSCLEVAVFAAWNQRSATAEEADSIRDTRGNVTFVRPSQTRRFVDEETRARAGKTLDLPSAEWPAATDFPDIRIGADSKVELSQKLQEFVMDLVKDIDSGGGKVN